MQFAYAVPDVHEAAAPWLARGIGPFFIREHIALSNVRLDAAPGSFDHSSAFAQMGDLMIELIQIHDPPGPTSVLHHMAFFVDDFDEARAALIDEGWGESVYGATSNGTEFGFFDARPELGHLVEIYERSDRLAAMYEQVRHASDTWDGTDPIRAF